MSDDDKDAWVTGEELDKAELIATAFNDGTWAYDLTYLARVVPRLVGAHRKALDIIGKCHDLTFSWGPATAAPLDEQLVQVFPEVEQRGYARGRGGAIEEAARYLRAYSQKATREGMPDTAALLTSAAEGIERHEDLTSKGAARGK